MAIRGIKAETINRNRDKWFVTFSIELARKKAKGKIVYRLPNGAYAVRK